MKLLFRIAGFALSWVVLVSGAQAASRTYAFAAPSFTSFDNTPVPFSTVAGNVTIDGTTVTAINLTIGSHTYSPSDVEYLPWDSMAILGGKMSDDDHAYTMKWGTDDFTLWGDFNNLQQWVGLSYTVTGVNGMFDSQNLSVSVVAVPEPEAYAMLLAGLGIVVATSRRRKQVA